MVASAQRKFLVVTLVAITVAVGVGAACVAAVGMALRQRTKLAEVRREGARLEEERAAVSAATRMLEAIARERELLAASFVDAAEPLPFIEAIEGLGRRAGVKVELALASGGSGGRADAYTVRASGSYPAVMAFLKHLESLPFLVDFGDVEIRGGGAPAAREAAAGAPRPSSEPRANLVLNLKIISL